MRTPLHRRTEKIGACLADPFANGEGRIELIRSPSPKGAGGGCIDLAAILAQSPAQCQSKPMPAPRVSRAWPGRMFFAGHTLINHGFMLCALYVRNEGRY